MKRLLIIMTIANTVMFLIGSSPYHAFGALVGAAYLMFEKDKEE